MPVLLRRLGQIVLFSCTCLGIFALGQESAHNKALHSDGQLKMQLARLPLAFEQNTGQASGTDFLLHSGVLQAQITGTRIRLILPPSSSSNT